MNHYDAACQPTCSSTPMIIWRRSATVLLSPDERCRRRRRPGLVPIAAAIITAIGAVVAAAVTGAFNFVR